MGMEVQWGGCWEVGKSKEGLEERERDGVVGSIGESQRNLLLHKLIKIYNLKLFIGSAFYR